jgi:hypothetical protein
MYGGALVLSMCGISPQASFFFVGQSAQAAAMSVAALASRTTSVETLRNLHCAMALGNACNAGTMLSLGDGGLAVLAVAPMLLAGLAARQALLEHRQLKSGIRDGA